MLKCIKKQNKVGKYQPYFIFLYDSDNHIFGVKTQRLT